MLQNQPFYLTNPHRPEEACLLLHGLGGGVYEMQLLGEYLHQQGMNVQGINYPGHDQPARRMPNSAWQDWYGHILETYKQLHRTHERVSLVGFSTGCPLALQLASEHPVDKLVLLSPFLKIKQEWFCFIPVEQLLEPATRFISDIPRLGLPINDRSLVAHAHKAAYYRTFNLSSVRSALSLIEEVKPKLPSIINPALIIQSPRDRVVCPTGAELLMSSLGSAHKQLIWLSRSDHVITLDYEREAVWRAVSDFIQSPSADTPHISTVTFIPTGLSTNLPLAANE